MYPLELEKSSFKTGYFIVLFFTQIDFLTDSNLNEKKYVPLWSIHLIDPTVEKQTLSPAWNKKIINYLRFLQLIELTETVRSLNGALCTNCLLVSDFSPLSPSA